MSAQRQIFQVAGIEARLAPFDWPFARAGAAEIAAHWAGLIAARPAMFDGRVLLGHALEHSDENGGLLRAEYFETAFSAFMAWRDFGFPGERVFNGFAMAALRAADGAYLLGEMSAHTANAGLCYFPAGTPDLDDVCGEQVDLAGSLVRELREETGIEARENEIDPRWTIVRLGPRLACMRAVRLKDRATDIAERVKDFLAQDSQPELAGIRIVRDMRDLERLQTPEFIRVFLAHEFGKA
ncbi:MAG: NUDIX hydrolase [Rhodoblastus sp.]